jgi:hypothetical protein
VSRESLVTAVVGTAKNLGWETVEADDAGSTVTLLLSAPGATEQLLEGPLHSLPKQLKDLGGPENYPATEEYEVPDDGLCDNEACQMPATTELPDGTPVCDECYRILIALGEIAAAAEFKERPAENFADPTPQAELAAEVAEVHGVGLGSYGDDPSAAEIEHDRHEAGLDDEQPAPSESTPDNDTSAAEDTAAIQVGRVVYVIRVDGKGEVARTVYDVRALVLARNHARKHGKENVHLFRVPVAGHISTALPRPVGERHNG